MARKSCPTCGTKVPNATRRCNYCGHKFLEYTRRQRWGSRGPNKDTIFGPDGMLLAPSRHLRATTIRDPTLQEGGD